MKMDYETWDQYQAREEARKRDEERKKKEEGLKMARVEQALQKLLG